MRNVPRLALILALFACHSQSVLHAAVEEVQSARHSLAGSDLPLHFEPNVGQAPGDVLYVARSPMGHGVSISAHGAVLSLPEPAPGVPLDSRSGTAPAVRTLKLTFVNPAPNVSVEGGRRLSGVVNYLVGSKENWRIGVPTYQEVRYRAVWSGIDAVLYGNGSRFEYDFIVSPGASHELISMKIEGGSRPVIAPDGALVIETKTHVIRHQPPVAYQGDRSNEVPVAFEVRPDDTVGFRVGAYDHGKPLVIDPILLCSSYVGGPRYDMVHAVAVDSRGGVYLAGSTESSSLATAGAADTTLDGTLDAFVMKLNPTLSELDFATYLGGSGEERAYTLVVDADRNVLVAGTTTSSTNSFPPTTTYGSGGSEDTFLVQLNSTGTTILSNLRISGWGNDKIWGIAKDGSDVYVCGATESDNFPTAGPPNPGLDHWHGSVDGFVQKIGANGALAWSRFIGGNGIDRCRSIGVEYGNVHIAGETTSSNFPVAGSAYQPTLRGEWDAFVMRLDAAAGNVQYSSYLGGSGDESGIASGPLHVTGGLVFVAGATTSHDFPVIDPVQATHGGGVWDAFLARMNTVGGALLFSTYFGGKGDDDALGVADASRASDIRVAIAGESDSSWGGGDLPRLGSPQGKHAGAMDAFVAVFKLSSRVDLLYTTFLGGEKSEWAHAITSDGHGNIYIAGQTGSADKNSTQDRDEGFPMAGRPFKVTLGGVTDGFVAMIPLDSDGDAIPDRWESEGVDYNADGTVDLPLQQSPFSASPYHPDLFVEIDSMSCSAAGGDGCLIDHDWDTIGDQPSEHAIRMVERSFAKSPVLKGSDLTSGIRVKIVLDQDPLPHFDETFSHNDNAFSRKAIVPMDDFYDYKLGDNHPASRSSDCGTGPLDGHFGTLDDRRSVNCKNILGARMFVFRYGVAGHNDEAGDSAGAAYLASPDFYIAVAYWQKDRNGDNLPDMQSVGGSQNWFEAKSNVEAATIMHELGHTLGLDHGGADDINGKPNYLSVMCYAKEYENIIPGRPLDFSRRKLATLDENHLNESTGVSDGLFDDDRWRTAYGYAPGAGRDVQVTPAAADWFDWNMNSQIDDPVPLETSHNINWIELPNGTTIADGKGERLEGHDDWSNLTFSFHRRLAKEWNGVAAASRMREPNPAAVRQAAQYVDADEDGFPNAWDNCPAIANPLQVDSDVNGVGDDCQFAATVDLVVSSGAAPDAIFPDTSVTYVLRVANLGELDATNVIATCDLPDSVIVDGVQSDTGSCTLGDPVVCTFAALPFGQAATIIVSFRPTAQGPMQIHDAVAGAESERDTANNHQVFVRQVLNPLDVDADGVPDAADSCPGVPNTGDQDRDGTDDACDLCPRAITPTQFDSDADGVGDDCDNCEVWNPDQADADHDGIGDACAVASADTDGDGVLDDGDGDGVPGSQPCNGTTTTDCDDNCPAVFNPDQEDDDSDGSGNACDWPDPGPDGDAVDATSDNCPDDPNPAQRDGDGDGLGDVCDADPDGDGIQAGDNCVTVPNGDQRDSDMDGLGDACDQATCRYAFTLIAETGAVYARFEDGFHNLPAINELGSVAFWAERTDGNTAILRDGTVVATTSGPMSRIEENLLSMNDAGTVLVSGLDDSSWKGLWVGNGGELERVSHQSAEGFERYSYAVINNAGDVAYDTYDRENGGVVVYRESPPYSAAPTVILGPSFNLESPLPSVSIDQAGNVAFMTCQRGMEWCAVLAGDGGPLRTIAHTSHIFSVILPFTGFESSGRVYFGAMLDQCIGEEPPRCLSSLFSGDGIRFTGLLDTFDRIENAAFTAQGGLAYVTNNGEAAYSGPDFYRDRAARIGDPAFGATITKISLGRGGINSAGQVALLLVLSDGRQVVVRADPSPDSDGDGWYDRCDHCPQYPSQSNLDTDGDGAGDVCDCAPADAAIFPGNQELCDGKDNDCEGGADEDFQGDADRVADCFDNCPLVENPGQEDRDFDTAGDLCDACPEDPFNDEDGDELCGDVENCPRRANTDQLDADGDGYGDPCDNCPASTNPGQFDADADGTGDRCTADVDGDGVPNEVDTDDDDDRIPDEFDNCPTVKNWSQRDNDADGDGDACDLDDRQINGGRGWKQSLPAPAGAKANGEDIFRYEWTPESTALAYNVYRVSLLDLSATNYGSCYRSQIKTAYTEIRESPTAGQGYGYLVTGEFASGEGSMGEDSAGRPRPNDFPCP